MAEVHVELDETLSATMDKDFQAASKSSMPMVSRLRTSTRAKTPGRHT